MRKFLLSFTGVLIVCLLIFNPTLQQFKEHTTVLVCDHGNIDAPIPAYQEHNYYLFSTYSGSIKCMNGEEKKLHYVGAVGYFFEIKL